MIYLKTFTYIEDIYYCIISYSGGHKIKSYACTQAFVKNHRLSLLIMKSGGPIKDQVKFIKTFEMLFSNINYNVEYGKVNYLYLKGIGFKVLNSMNFLLFKLNYSHYLYYCLPLEMKVNVKKKQKLVKFNYFQEIYAQNVINNLHKFRISNPYTRKGIFKSNQLVFKKEGKRKQV